VEAVCDLTTATCHLNDVDFAVEDELEDVNAPNPIHEVLI